MISVNVSDNDCLVFNLEMLKMRITMKNVQSLESVKKARRRQADARWRANVTRCYETLKHIIPVYKRASQHQISKVF